MGCSLFLKREQETTGKEDISTLTVSPVHELSKENFVFYNIDAGSAGSSAQ